jgi:hypothetical protein
MPNVKKCADQGNLLLTQSALVFDLLQPGTVFLLVRYVSVAVRRVCVYLNQCRSICGRCSVLMHSRHDQEQMVELLPLFDIIGSTWG